MRSAFKFVLAVCILFVGAGAKAAPSERRIALVIGNANYQAGALPTPANDAGLIAQTLQAAGFDVTGARGIGASLFNDKCVRTSAVQHIRFAMASAATSVDHECPLI